MWLITTLPVRKTGGYASCAFKISSHNCRVKAVVGVVGNADCIVLGVVSDDTEDWPKDFFSPDRHVVLQSSH